MSTLSVANQAGSAGKTTTVVAIATLLAQAGHRVRIIDLDGQANATYSLAATATGLTIADVLLRRATIAEAEQTTAVPGLTIVPADARVDGAAIELDRGTIGGEQRLKVALAAADQVDVTLLDCPGALSIITVAALVASDAVLTVAQPTVKEIQGIPKLEATISDVATAYNPGLKLGAIIPCIVPPASAGGIYVDALGLLEDYNGLVAPTVRRSVRVAEAYANQTPLPIHAPRELVTADYVAVVAFLAAKALV